MTAPRRPTPVDRWALRAADRLLDFRWPPLAAAAAAAGFQAAGGFGLPVPWVAPAVCLLAGGLWAALAVVYVSRIIPLRQAAGAALTALQPLAGVWAFGGRVGWLVGGGLVLVVLAVPAWPAVVAWAALVLVVGLAALRVPPAGADQSRLLPLVRLVGAGWLVVGLGAAVAGWRADDPAGLVGRSAAGLLAAAVAAAAVAADADRRPRRLLALAPFAVPLFARPAGGPAVLLVTLAWPAVLFGWAFIRYRQCVTRFDAELRGGRLEYGSAPLGPVEDEVRESDGYYRVCYPNYRHLDPARGGETGYLCQFHHPDPQSGEAVAFRHTALFDSPLADRPDAVGRQLAEAVRRAVPDAAAVGLAELRPFSQAFRDGPGNVFRLRPQDPVLLAKLPWDHPWLLVVPVEWAGVLVYPPGAGLYDSAGLPCVVPGLSVTVGLRPAVRAAVDAAVAGRPAPDQAVLLRQLVWNASRVLPAVYERLLVALGRAVREEEIGLPLDLLSLKPGGDVVGGAAQWANDQTGGAGADPAQTRRLCHRLTDRLAAPDELPAPLGELVEVRVTALEIKSYLKEDKLRDLRSKLANALSNRRSVQLPRIDDLYDSLRGVLRKMLGNGDEVFDLKAKVMSLSNSVHDSADRSRRIFLGAVAGGKAVAAAGAEAERELTEAYNAFEAFQRDRHKEVEKKLDKLQARQQELLGLDDLTVPPAGGRA